MYKKMILPVFAVALMGTGLLASSQVFAENTDSFENPMSALAKKIASRFNLSKEDVQAVFDQDRADRQAEMELRYEAQLNQYVAEGKITEAQKTLILAKHKEIEPNRQKERPDLKSMTEEEQKKAMEANKIKKDEERQDLEDWQLKNGIDIKYLIGGFGRQGGFRGGPPTKTDGTIPDMSERP